MAGNHELLGRRWVYQSSLTELLEHLRQDDARLAGHPLGLGAVTRIMQKRLWPVLHHLGFGPVPANDVRRQVNEGVDLALEYFLGDWWRPERVDRDDLEVRTLRWMAERHPGGLTAQQYMSGWLDQAARRHDKGRPDRQLEWFDVLHSALFLGGLAGRWADLTRLGAWFDATIEPEYKGEETNVPYQLLYLCLAGDLAPEPMAGMDALLAKVKAGGRKRTHLLCAAWEAVRAGDQWAFERALCQAVKHHLARRLAGQATEWVPLDVSTLCLLAEHRGLAFPPLSPELAAGVVTRRSAGMVD